MVRSLAFGSDKINSYYTLPSGGDSPFFEGLIEKRNMSTLYMYESSPLGRVFSFLLGLLACFFYQLADPLCKRYAINNYLWLLIKLQIQVLFYSVYGSFQLSLTVLFSIAHNIIFSLRGWFPFLQALWLYYITNLLSISTS